MKNFGLCLALLVVAAAAASIGCGKPSLDSNLVPPEGCSLVCENGYLTDAEGKKICKCAPKASCVCPGVYNPICGTDGKTYDNSCFAACAGVTAASAGECKTQCQTLNCALDCKNGYVKDSNGCDICQCYECPQVKCSQNCPDGYKKDERGCQTCECAAVCQPLTCRMNCEHGLARDANGCDICECYICPDLKCKECEFGNKLDERGCRTCVCLPCDCSDASEPVCGSDGKTYLNECRAVKCAKVGVKYAGECENPVECSKDSECGDQKICLNKVCVPGERCGDKVCGYGKKCEQCPIDPDCPGCKNCNPSICVNADDGCWIHDIDAKCACFDRAGGGVPCPSGYKCEVADKDSGFGYCVLKACSSSEDCPKGYDCVNGACVASVKTCEQAGGKCVGLYPGSKCPAGYRAAAEGEPQCAGDGAMCCLACSCPAVYAPVCGNDGKTYGNECEAKCAGVSVAYTGECKTMECKTGSDCPTGYVCENGACVKGGDCGGKTCASDQKCESCPVDPNCPMCEYCPAAICVPVNDGCVMHDVYGRCACYMYADMEYCPAGTKCKEISEGFGYCAAAQTCEQAGGKCVGVYPGSICPQGYRQSNDNEPQCAGVGAFCCLPCSCPEVYSPVCGSDGKTYGNECEAKCAGVSIAYTGECKTMECKTGSDCPTGYVCKNGLCVKGTQCGNIVCNEKQICEQCPIDPNCPICAYCPQPICVPADDGCKAHDMYGACVCGTDSTSDYCPPGHYCEFNDPSMLLGYCKPQNNCVQNGGICAANPASCPDKYGPFESSCPESTQTCCNKCVCPDVMKEVCGYDNKTYFNECYALCAKTTVAYGGACSNAACTGRGCSQPNSVCVNGKCVPGTICPTDMICYGDKPFCDGCPVNVDCPMCSSCPPPVCYNPNDGCVRRSPYGDCVCYPSSMNPAADCPVGYICKPYDEDGYYGICVK